MPVTTNTGGNAFLTKVYNIETVDDCRELYDQWADTFDRDLKGPQQDYVAPTFVAKAVNDNGGNLNGAVFDAGCGTGLSGVAMAAIGAKTIDGVDVSPGMLKFADKTGVYRHVEPADLTKAIPNYDDGSYDIVICVGTLTHGHVGPTPAMSEFARITKSGGLIVATVLDDIWVSGGYEAEVERLRNEGAVEFVSAERADYRRAAGVQARILVLRRN